jgi:alpha-glucosidase
MTRATFDAQAAHARGLRTFTVTRAGPPGLQRYAQTWSGDNTTSWHHMRWNIRMGLTMSLSGMFNTGHDVGGFFGPVADPELLVRWVQSAAFNPRCLMNSWKAGGEVNTPWMHPEVLPIVRDWLRLRYRMMPYLYTLYARAARLHQPILRPRFYEFPGDPRAFEDTDDFLVGPNLLVAPVAEPGVRRRQVYLPQGPGGWIDFWSGAHHPSGSTVTVDAPLERIPLFVPEGAIVPATDSADMRRKHDEPSRALRVFPGRGRGKAAFALYEDDGATLRYAEGDYAELHCTLSWTPRTIHVSVRAQGRFALPYATVRVVLPPGDERPVEVEGKGIELVK